MPYCEGVDYPNRKDDVRVGTAGLVKVHVQPGPQDIPARKNACIDNALEFREHYGLKVVRGYIALDDKLLIEHYWNEDAGLYYDITPLDTKFDYYIEQVKT